jgi:hypothetical protein
VRSSSLEGERGLTSISHGEELFGILAVPLSADALWGRQLQAQGDIAIRFNRAVATFPDGGGVGDVLTMDSVGSVSRNYITLTSTSLTVIIVLLGTTEKVLRTAKREAAVVSIVCGSKHKWVSA